MKGSFLNDDEIEELNSHHHLQNNADENNEEDHSSHQLQNHVNQYNSPFDLQQQQQQQLQQQQRRTLYVNTNTGYPPYQTSDDLPQVSIGSDDLHSYSQLLNTDSNSQPPLHYQPHHQQYHPLSQQSATTQLLSYSQLNNTSNNNYPNFNNTQQYNQQILSQQQPQQLAYSNGLYTAAVVDHGGLTSPNIYHFLQSTTPTPNNSNNAVINGGSFHDSLNDLVHHEYLREYAAGESSTSPTRYHHSNLPISHHHHSSSSRRSNKRSKSLDGKANSTSHLESDEDEGANEHNRVDDDEDEAHVDFGEEDGNDDEDDDDYGDDGNGDPIIALANRYSSMIPSSQNSYSSKS